MKKHLVIAVLSFFNISYATVQLPYCDTYAAMMFTKNYLPDNPVIIECGGCNGHDTRLMTQTWPLGEVHTFEPVPALFQVLKANTLLFSNVFSYELALGDYCGKALFHVSKYNDINSGSSSLLPPKKHVERDPQTKFDEKIIVNIVTLDAWAAEHGIQYIDFLWLDMQGYELNMLKVSELAKKAKVIFTEVEFIDLYAGQYLYQDVFNWMLENNFELVAKDFTEANGDFGNACFVKKNL